MSLIRPMIDVVCAVLFDEGARVLIAQRASDKSLGGLWEFPGGKVEPGESLESALVREVSEELGADVLIETDGVAPFGTFDHDLATVTIRLHPVVCTLAPGSARPRALEHIEVRWIGLDEDGGVDWAPGDRRIFHALGAWRAE